MPEDWMSALDATYDGSAAMHMAPGGGMGGGGGHGISAPQLSYDGLDVDDIFRPHASLAPGPGSHDRPAMRNSASRMPDCPFDSLVRHPQARCHHLSP